MIPGLALALVLLLFGPLPAQDRVLEELSEQSGRDITEDLEDLRIDRLDLNSAGREELLLIPWIDDRIARSIIAGREESGGYRKPEDLLRVDGITPELYEKISPFLTVEAGLEGVVRIDSRRRSVGGDRRLRAALSKGWFSGGIRAARGASGGPSTAGGYLSVSHPVLRGARITAGGMYLRLGQGLLSWPSFGAQRYSGRPIVYPLERGGIRGTTSGDTGRVVQGVGVSWNRESWKAGFLHGQRGDARRRRSVSAAHIDIRLPAGIESAGNLLLVEGSVPLASVTVRAGTETLLLFAEAADRGGSGAAALAGVKKEAGDCSLLALYRRHSTGFRSLLGFDMSQPGSGAGNLTAMYLAFILKAGRAGALRVYADTGSRKGIPGEQDAERFQEFSFLWRLSPFRRASSSLMLVVERTAVEEPGEIRQRRTRFRWDSSFGLRSGLEIGMRWYVVAGLGDRSWRASLISLKIRCERLLGFDVRASVSLYHATEGGSLYLVEGGLPERSLFLRLSGDGERYAVVVTRKVAGRWIMRWKLAGTSRLEPETLKGFELGCWRRELMQEFQLELRL